MKKKLILLAVLGAGVFLFFFYHLEYYFSLESLKDHRDKLHTFYEANSLTMILGFVGVYIVTVTFSLPGAAILTLTAGAIFGPWIGTLAVNLGATIGATLAFLVARFLIGDWVKEKFGEKLKSFNDGFSKNTVNYILFLRLVPLFPFFLINLISGLTSVSLRVYFFGTMFGTLPGTFVYANAGSNLASINSLSDIASPGVLGAFTLLGIFTLIPIVYRKLKGRNKAPYQAST